MSFIPPKAPPTQFPPSYPDVILHSTPYTDAIVASNPKLWWRFNDASGATILDTMGFANGIENDPAATLYDQAGLITEVNQFSQGAVNNATSFVTAVIPAGVPLAGGWTLEWWTAVQPLAMFQNAIKVGTDGASQVIFACFDGAGTGSALIGATPVGGFPGGTFAITGNYYAITYDGANTRFYKNGVLLVTSAAALAGTRVANLGFAAGASGGAKFGGFMDEMALYATALTAPQLLAHYNAGIATIVNTTVPGNEQQTGIGGTAVPSNAPPLTPQAPIATLATPSTPAAAPVPPRNYQDGYTTQDQINTLFKIVSPRPGSGS